MRRGGLCVLAVLGAVACGGRVHDGDTSRLDASAGNVQGTASPDGGDDSSNDAALCGLGAGVSLVDASPNAVAVVRNDDGPGLSEFTVAFGTTPAPAPCGTPVGPCRVLTEGCPRSPAGQLNAGTVTLRAPEIGVVPILQNDAGAYTYTHESPLLNELALYANGDTLCFSASGGAFAAFPELPVYTTIGGAQIVEPPIMFTVTPIWPIPSADDFAVTWTQTSPGDTFEVSIFSAPSDAGPASQYPAIECAFDGSSMTTTIPKAALSVLAGRSVSVVSCDLHRMTYAFGGNVIEIDVGRPCPTDGTGGYAGQVN